MLDIHFAPLQGFTECAYRQAHFLFANIADERSAANRNFSGIKAYYTPFLRVEKGEVRSKDLRNLQQDLDFIKRHRTNVCHCENQGYSESECSENHFYNVVPQIICRDALEFRILVDAIEKLKQDCGFAPDEVFPQIDINMGCPFPMQAKAGRGSGLLPRVDAVKEILQEVAKLSTPDVTLEHSDRVQASMQLNKATGIKFSIKMRLGYTNPDECMALLPLINSTPLAHVTMHPRLGIQQYKGALDFQSFTRFYEECNHPLLFNGDIKTLHDIDNIEKEFPKLAGVMIGRRLLANPTLSTPYPLKTLLQIHDYILGDYRKRLQGEAQVLDKIRTFWTYPLEESQASPSIAERLPKRLLKKVQKARNLNDYTIAIQEFQAYE